MRPPFLLFGTPHLTVGYHPQMVERTEIEPIRWTAREFALVRSHVGQSRYDILKRWALKGSDHLMRLRELHARYPDAILLWTHRDLSQQLGSLASAQAILCGIAGEV